MLGVNLWLRWRSWNCIYSLISAHCSLHFVLMLYLPVTPTPVWGFSVSSVTIINAFSLTGVFIVPLMKTRYMKYALTFFIALAIGTLFSTAILQLLPEVWHLDLHASVALHIPQTFAETLRVKLAFIHRSATDNQSLPDTLIMSWCFCTYHV